MITRKAEYYKCGQTCVYSKLVLLLSTSLKFFKAVFSIIILIKKEKANIDVTLFKSYLLLLDSLKVQKSF